MLLTPLRPPFGLLVWRLQVLKGFKNSTLGREQEVFACMVHNLFDEYRFFPKYPDRELHTTGTRGGRMRVVGGCGGRGSSSLDGWMLAGWVAAGRAGMGGLCRCLVAGGWHNSQPSP